MPRHRLCGYLPLALRIAGARLVSRAAWKVSWFATRLADESKRLDLLKAGDLEIRASFGLNYHGRAETEQRAFRMLGLLAADFPARNLAAVLETDTDDAEELLELLPVMFDWRADWSSWKHTHQLALDAARQAGDADAEAGILRSLGALYRELGRPPRPSVTAIWGCRRLPRPPPT